MKLQKANFESEILGAEKELDFSIDTSSSVIFDILRDKMYTNKVAAVCREISSNSRDANREAGRGEIPIKISIIQPFELESISDESIIFEDNGLGITPDRMSSIFVKYAASTKSNDNLQTGGFGLGAKTPFAYSDTFTVITVCDFEGERREYTYTAMIDDTQKGKMILFDSKPSIQETGTRVIVPIKSVDKTSFEREVIKATSLWEIKPILSGFSSIYMKSCIETVIEYKNFKVISDEFYFYSSYFIANIDGIPYPINTIDLGLQGDLDSFKFGVGMGTPIILTFGIGELSISANREGIHYTEETKTLLVERVKLSLQSGKELLDEYFSTDNYLEGCIRVNEIFSKD